MGKFESKKFTVVILILFTTVALALTSKMTGDVANVLTGLAVMYPAAQGWVDGKSAKL